MNRLKCHRLLKWRSQLCLQIYIACPPSVSWLLHLSPWHRWRITAGVTVFSLQGQRKIVALLCSSGRYVCILVWWDVACVAWYLKVYNYNETVCVRFRNNDFLAGWDARMCSFKETRRVFFLLWPGGRPPDGWHGLEINGLWVKGEQNVWKIKVAMLSMACRGRLWSTLRRWAIGMNWKSNLTQMWGYSIIHVLYSVYIHTALTILLGLLQVLFNFGVGSLSPLNQSLTGTSVSWEAGGSPHSKCSSLWQVEPEVNPDECWQVEGQGQ